jgi:hypothetical protein
LPLLLLLLLCEAIAEAEAACEAEKRLPGRERRERGSRTSTGAWSVALERRILASMACASVQPGWRRRQRTQAAEASARSASTPRPVSLHDRTCRRLEERRMRRVRCLVRVAPRERGSSLAEAAAAAADEGEARWCDSSEMEDAL